MTLIEAINKAKHENKNVISTRAFTYYTSDVPVCVFSGKADPEYLIAIIGKIAVQDLLSDMWNVEEERIEITATELSKAITEIIPDRGSVPVSFHNVLWEKLKEGKEG